MAIYIDPTVAENITSLSNAAKEYNKAVDDVFTKLTELSTSMEWVGPDNDTFISNVTPYKPKLQQLGDVLQDIANDVDSGIAAIYRVQASVTKAASNF